MRVLTWGSIIDALGGTVAAADALEESKSTVSGWRTRGIPAARWSAVVALAADFGRREITLDVLAALASQKRDAALEEARP